MAAFVVARKARVTSLWRYVGTSLMHLPAIQRSCPGLLWTAGAALGPRSPAAPPVLMLCAVVGALMTPHAAVEGGAGNAVRVDP